MRRRAAIGGQLLGSQTLGRFGADEGFDLGGVGGHTHDRPFGNRVQTSLVEDLRTVSSRREHRVESEFGGQVLRLRTTVEARFGSGVDADGHGTVERGRFQAAAETVARLQDCHVVVGGETVGGDDRDPSRRR